MRENATRPLVWGRPALNMTVCRSSCSVDCKSCASTQQRHVLTHTSRSSRGYPTAITCVARYDLPLGVCYSPPLLFPGDPQWGAGDVLDQCDAAAGILTRTLYSSSGGTCRGGGSPVQAPHTPHARHSSYTPHTHERALRRKPAQTSLPRTVNEDRLSP